jgi:hypothetical protein
MTVKDFELLLAGTFDVGLAIAHGVMLIDGDTQLFENLARFTRPTSNHNRRHRQAGGPSVDEDLL